ncbi:paraquat-inducible protein A [Paraburkholderia tropica]|uniref:Paraquat-inducible protein A n=1 Tax=Paraburkholderia tropica TaxID=92647 RepID=A0A1A5X698_9BURK|nr:paraquat-inducible protein A [Paraburkholderia tropica]MBB2979748.1 paraquat-inducible protein A [Paraburkholderia tropica]OBR49076.1 paraquat-inducible protein A [Paraburkholderia tropica]RQN39433.1 paraquat-inducible protein A [Paraburkholderia tropica]SEJ67532.1 paraquat-inducible protein A [Paraburkholderia tropica]
MKHAGLLLCHECDLLQRRASCPHRGVLRCRRCGAELERDHTDSSRRSLALASGALVLFVISNLFPIVGLAVNGNLIRATLWGAVEVLYLDGMWPIAGLVFITTILMPATQIVTLLWLLVPLEFGRKPREANLVFRVMGVARTWGMTEVLILGLLIALVKLSHIATVVTGVALWSFGALMVVLAGTGAALDVPALWHRIAPTPGFGSWSGAARAARPRPDRGLTGAACGLALCPCCELIVRLPASGGALACPRCATPLHLRKAGSLSRTWAFLIASIVLYIPANVLPVMDTSSLFGTQKDTIMSGVVYLWVSGSWPLAVVVFIASIAVPMIKILGLGYLAASAQRASRWLPQERTRIYRMIELVGRWSMLDIYVVTMLVALVQFKALATIKAGPAAIAFGAVVVMTMFAASAFDPRLIWDPLERDHA